MNKAVFPALTGIRAVAAAMVVIHHLVEPENKVLIAILKELNIGVSIFFVLSGFLITYRYYDNISLSKNWWITYLRNRFARIYPLFFLLTTASFALTYFVTDLSFYVFSKQYLLNITLLKGFLPDYAYTGISQSWTLTVEECFYLTAPFIFFLIRKKVNLYIQCISLTLIGLMIYTVFSGFVINKNLSFVLITTIFGRIYEFAAGIVLGILLIKNAEGLSTGISKIFKQKYLTYTSILLFVAAFIFLVSLQNQDFKYSIQTPAGYLITVIIIPIITAALFLGLITEKTFIRKILSTPVFIYLGKSSYALYLFHWGIFGYIINQVVNNNIILSIIVTYLASFILYSLVEEPLNKIIRNKYAVRVVKKEVKQHEELVLN